MRQEQLNSDGDWVPNFSIFRWILLWFFTCWATTDTPCREFNTCKIISHLCARLTMEACVCPIHLFSCVCVPGLALTKSLPSILPEWIKLWYLDCNPESKLFPLHSVDSEKSLRCSQCSPKAKVGSQWGGSTANHPPPEVRAHHFPHSSHRGF